MIVLGSQLEDGDGAGLEGAMFGVCNCETCCFVEATLTCLANWTVLNVIGLWRSERCASSYTYEGARF
jgi:hypothetical protein